MPNSDTLAQLAYFAGMVLFTIIGAAFNNRHTNRKINARNETLDELKKTIEKQAKQIDNQNDQIAGLKDDLTQTQAERDTRIGEVTRLNDRLDIMQKRIDGLEATNTQAAQDMLRLTRERDEITDKHRLLNEQYTQVLEDNISMGKTLAKLQDEMDALKIDIAAYKRVDQIVKEMTGAIGTAIKEGVQQALSTSEVLKLVPKLESAP